MNPARFGASRGKQDVVGIGVVLLSALLIGLAPNAAKLAYQGGANLSSVVVFCTVIGAAGIALYLSLRGRWPVHGWSGFRRSVISGVAQAFTTIGFIGSVAFLDVSLAALIFYFHPFLVAAAGHFRGDFRINSIRIACIAVAVAGLALVLGVTFTTLSVAGVGLSLIGVVAVTVMILTVSDLSKAFGPIPANFYMSFLSSVFLLCVAIGGSMVGWLDGMLLPASVLGWVAIAGAGVTTTCGYVMFFIGAGMIGTTRAVVWTVTEPIFAILLAILLVNEWLSPWQWIGVVIVTGSLVKFESSSRSDAVA